MSPTVRVNPAVLVTDGDDLHTIASTLQTALTSATSSLNGYGGMAGDDDGAEAFAEVYDEASPKVLKGVGNVIEALRGLDAAITDTAHYYKGAEAVGAQKDPGSVSPAKASAPRSVSVSTPASVLGGGWPGSLGEFQELLESALATLGVVIPTGDPGKLRNAASTWDSLEGDLTSAKSSVSSAFTAVQSMDLPQKADILACRTRVATLLTNLSSDAGHFGTECRTFAQSIDDTREELMWMVGQMAAEIMLDIGIGLVLGPLTAGIGTALMAGKAGVTIMKWARRIAELIQRLKQATRLRAIALRGFLRAIGEGAQSAVATMTVQVAVNALRDPEGGDPNVFNAGAASFFGGAASSPVGNMIARNSDNVARRAIAGVGEGATDGFVSSYTDVQLNGGSFNPLSSMVAGSILGGIMRPALSGGGRATTPTTPGGGGRVNPGGSGGPTPGGGGAGSGSGSNAPTPGRPVDVDPSGAPQPGGGGGPSTTAPGGGTPDVPSGDAPTPGGGGSDAPSGGGGNTPDIPSGGTPDAPAGGTPDAPAAGTPDAPAAGTPDAPAAGTPDAPSAGTPDAPAAGTPDAPSAGTPDAPSAGTPDAPSVGTPDAPSVGTPDAPSVGTPDAPSAPDAPVAQSPEFSNAPTPDVPTSPDAPVAQTPEFSDAPTPDVPSTTDAPPAQSPEFSHAPEADTPTGDAPSGQTPPVFSAASGGVPSAGTPGTPDAASSNTPAPDAPSSPEGNAPATPGDGNAPESDAPTSDAPTSDAPESPDAVDAADAAAMAAGAAGAAGVAVGPRVVNFTNPVTGSSRTPGTAPSTPDAPSSDAANGDSGAPSSSESDTPTTPESNAPESDTPQSETSPSRDSAGDAGNPDSDVPSLDDIRSWLAEVNPGFTGHPTDPRSNNCGSTSAAVYNRLNGNGAPVAGVDTLSTPEMEAATGRPQVAMTPDQIRDELVAGGPGSHAVVGVDRAPDANGDPQPGHWFNAYYDGTNVVAVDGQSGQIHSWPPDYGDVVHWDAAVDPATTPEAPDANSTSDNGGSDANGARNGDSSSPEDTRGSSVPRDPAVQQPLTPYQSGIIDGAHAGNSDSRVVESQEVRDEVEAYNNPKPAHGMLDSQYGPKTGRTLVTGAAADALNFDRSQPWGHDANGDPLNKKTWSERYVDPGDKMHFAPNDGAVPDTRVQYNSISGFLSDWGNLDIDRLGKESGSFMGVGGGDFNQRALPPGQAKADLLHEVSWNTETPLPKGWVIEIARIADAYGLDGGGLQMVVRDGPGADSDFVSLERLKALGLVNVTTVVGAP